MSANSHRGSKSHIPLELGLQVGVGHRGGCWEVNLGPVEEQHMLLTTEPSPQLHQQDWAPAPLTEGL